MCVWFVWVCFRSPQFGLLLFLFLILFFISLKTRRSASYRLYFLPLGLLHSFQIACSPLPRPAVDEPSRLLAPAQSSDLIGGLVNCSFDSAIIAPATTATTRTIASTWLPLPFPDPFLPTDLLPYLSTASMTRLSRPVHPLSRTNTSQSVLRGPFHS